MENDVFVIVFYFNDIIANTVNSVDKVIVEDCCFVNLSTLVKYLWRIEVFDFFQLITFWIDRECWFITVPNKSWTPFGMRSSFTKDCDCLQFKFLPFEQDANGHVWICGSHFWILCF